ncbi:hypothetical protein LCGC14_2102810, partial [marine sediment metagenome]
MPVNTQPREQMKYADLSDEKLEKAAGLIQIKGEHLGNTLNVEEEAIYSNIRHSIALGLPQVFPHQLAPYKVAIIGGGPSLEYFVEDIRERFWRGDKIIALNNTYNWLIDNNIRPSAVVMADSRDFMARFVERAVPDCKYFIASQCAPEVFAKVMDRETHIWHCCNDETEVDILDEYYLGHNYHPVAGGSTVALRAIGLMRMLGNRYMDLFGIDSCHMNGKHHAYEQPENDDEEVRSIVYA